MKKVVLVGAVALTLLNSCAVQQFQVNTQTKDFENGGRVFGEKTSKFEKNKDYAKSGTMFILGINAMSDATTLEMAKKINADKYTIETKNNFLSLLVAGFTSNLVQYKVVKVIKRNK